MNKLILSLIALIFTNMMHGQVSFISNGQNLKSDNSWYIHLSDMDKDGDLDAYFENALWLNNGKGEFNNTGKRLTKSYFPNFADVNNDGLDDLIEKDSIFINDGDFSFKFHKIVDCDIKLVAAHLFDINNDKFKDMVVCSGNSDRILINNGKGEFINTGDSLGGWGQCSYAFGDINSDGFIDIYVGIPHNPPPVFGTGINKIWFGDKSGKFKLKEHKLENAESRGVILKDFDNDNDLDLYVSDRTNGGRIWFNDGNGNFTDSGQRLGGFVGASEAADFDSDGDIDLLICEDAGGEKGLVFSNGAPNKIWLNNGIGHFIDSELTLGNSNTMSVAVGELNGDNMLDIFGVNVKLVSSPSGPPKAENCDVEIWINNTGK
jgi:hypothetical protein